MSDSSQGGPPPPYGQQPYGQQPPARPYGSPDGENPYGAAPVPPAGPPTQPSGQPSPYAQPNPYGAAPYAHQPGQPGYGGPLGDGLDMYGRPIGQRVIYGRPGTVTTAGWVTLVVAGLSFLLYGFLTLAMLVAKDEVTREIDKAISDSGQSTTTFNAQDAYGVVVVVLVVVTTWCLIACLLAIFAMRRSNAARITLVVSAVVAGLLSLAGIGSIVSAVPLLACIAVVVLLFTGGANEWYRERP